MPGREGTCGPVRGLLHNRPSAKVGRPQRARRIDGVEWGRGRPVFECHPARVAGLERECLIQRRGEDHLVRPLGKRPGSCREGTHDIDDHGYGRNAC